MNERLFNTLLTFGYRKREAKTLTQEIEQNLKKYLTVYEARLQLIRRVQNVRK